MVKHFSSPTNSIGRKAGARRRWALLIASLALTVVTGAGAGGAASAVPAHDVQSNSSGTGGVITRDEVLSRAQYWIDQHVPYSQTSSYPDPQGVRYRQDCSGYVSMAWHLPKLPGGGDYSTATITQVTSPIARSELKPGDALWRRDSSVQHIALFVRWADTAQTKPVVREEPDYGKFAQETTWSSSYANTFTPLRYRNIDVAEPRPVDRTEGDVTGDGYADLTAVDADGRLVVFGNGLLLPEHHGMPFQGRMWQTDNTNWGRDAKSMTVADVTGDGYGDFLVLTASGKLQVYGNGSLVNADGAPFTTVYREYPNWAGATHIAAGDVNHDGWADLVATMTDESLRIFLNTKEIGGNAWPFRDVGITYPRGWGDDVRDIAIGDVTGDGYGDLVSIRDDGTLTVFGNGILLPGNNGFPFVNPTWSVKSGWDQVDDTSVSDVTGDGYADLMGVTGSGELQIYDNVIRRTAGQDYYQVARWRYTDWVGVHHIA
ncbi:VCBS repeat-containing protein [Saccharothrix sp. 6-C]|uniref:FG-GAP repeat domain-containing protein n=1 Tax=Saccharothrix sp. 6-C TaxID=2781735 RepID=UPI0019172F9B|nr:VCBS repeat-containing protein [Saccharothrix sp. 6-C]QQQ73421.1 VCBS repeat-containing protein [Saccharothrix sp. 6-C]